MITLEQVEKQYGSHNVLHELSLSVHPGEHICLSGPSGSGKSTLLEIIASLRSIDSGSRDIGSQRIGFAFQDDVLIPWLTVRENMLLALTGVKEFTSTERNAAAQQWLSYFELEDHQEGAVNNLSGGMKKRLSVARALSVEPVVLLLDEPFAYQDERNIALIKSGIEAVCNNQEVTVIVTTHIPVLWNGFFDRVVSIASLQGTP